VLAVLLALAALPALAGNVRGVVRFEGEPPLLRPILMRGAPECARLHEEAPPNPILMLGEQQGLGNVLVRVRRGASGEVAPPQEPVTLELRGCLFAPRVLAVMAGQTLRIVNVDPLPHTVEARAQINDGAQQLLAQGSGETTWSFEQVEPPFRIKSGSYPWMNAFLAVVDNPYYDVTDGDGRFELDALPPGDYELEAWHEKLKTQSAKIRVEDGVPARVELVFTAPAP
jgi:plastocyanin